MFQLSARNRRILALGVHGAADDAELDLPALLERVEGRADLEPADLETLRSDLRAAGEQILESDAGMDELAQLQDIDAAIQAVMAQESANEEAAAAIAAEVDAIASRIRGDAPAEPEADAGPDDDETDDADDAEGDAPAEPEAPETPAEEPAAPEAEAPVEQPIAAAASPARTRARRPAATLPRAAATEPEPAMTLRASANVPGVPAGQVLDTPEAIWNTYDQAIRATRGYRGPRMEIPLMSLGSFHPTDVFGDARTLGRDARRNDELINRVTSEQAIRASGGICAPAPIDYSLPMVGTDERPVKAALAQFGVPRGGIRLRTPPVFTDTGAGVGTWTAANDLSPSSPTTKPCATIDCPDEVETTIFAITQCLRIGNFMNLYDPETVENWVKNVGVFVARYAERKALTTIGSLSTQVAATEVLGTTRAVLAALDRNRAQMGSQFRISPNFPLRVLAPAWLRDNMRTDLAREAPGSSDERLATADAKLQSFFSSRNLNVGWTYDGESGQEFAAQTDGNMVGWPDEVVLYVYPEGSWLHLDGGMLDFGLVRDSTLNATNDLEIFSEVMENVAFHGVAGTSRRITVDICPNGQAAALDDTSSICTSGS